MLIMIFAMVNEATQQSPRMVSNICGCVPKGRAGVVFECKNSCPRDILRQEVSRPERFRVRICPGFGCISIQAMNNNNTLVIGERWVLKGKKKIHLWPWHLLYSKRLNIFLASSRRHNKQAHGEAG